MRDRAGRPLKEIGQVPVKLDFPLSGFDISWVNARTNRYLLTSHWSRNPKDMSNPGNNALLIFDATNAKLLKTVHEVHGAGVVSSDDGKVAWVGSPIDGVDVVDVVKGTLIDKIATGANEGGGDELAFDGKDEVVAVRCQTTIRRR